MGFGRGERRRGQACRAGADFVRFKAGAGSVDSSSLRLFAGERARVFNSGFFSIAPDFTWWALFRRLELLNLHALSRA